MDQKKTSEGKFKFLPRNPPESPNHSPDVLGHWVSSPVGGIPWENSKRNFHIFPEKHIRYSSRVSGKLSLLVWKFSKNIGLPALDIEVHLSPGKCQITALAVLNNDLYIGTTWGCLIIVEKDTMRPITVFRPFDDEVRCILPLFTPGHNLVPLVVTIGRGYRSLIHRYTDSAPKSITTPSGNERRHLFGSPEHSAGGGGGQKDRSNNMHALIWRADHWTPV